MVEQDWNAPTPKPVQDIVEAVRNAEEQIAAIPECALQRFMAASLGAVRVALLLEGPREDLGARLDKLMVTANENLGQWRVEAGF